MCTEKSIEELMINAKCKSSADYKKQMKIVDAVNETEADSAPLGATTVYIHSSEGYLFGCNVTSQTVCTIEEYNQCIEEMKYHYDIPKWCSYNRADKELLTVENSDQSFYEKEKFVYGQDVYVNHGEWENRPMKFGCFTLDNKKALLFDVDGDGYCRFAVESISSKPIKSKEDIEMEAKEDQVIDMIGTYHDAYHDGGIKALFELMQENGDLAPIKLTE